ncbi:MAG: hypothetical protein CL666_12225 [Balneola sp.]|nr:hypothetical protein [Balneola sp.]
MKKISEHSIEQYIRFSDELSSARKREIKQVIDQSEELQATYQFLLSYYEELDRVFGVQPFVFPLKPLQLKERSAGPVVLAAMTSAQERSMLQTRVTLVSEENNRVVRVLENERDNCLQFHVISEKEGQNERVILSLVKPEIDLVTDEFGKLKGVRDLSNIDWNSIYSVLRVPGLKLEIDPEYHSFPVADHSKVQLSFDGKKIEISVAHCDNDYSRILLVQKGSTELQIVTANKVVFNLEANDKPFSLYFYE